MGLKCWAVLAVLAFTTFPGALSWGHDGHLVVCAIANGLLTDEAKARVQELLPPWASGYLPGVCSWADVVGHTAPWRWSLPLHYADTPDGLCSFDLDRDCHYGVVPNKCVVAGINNYTTQLHTLPAPATAAKPLQSVAASAAARFAGLQDRAREQADQLQRLSSAGLGEDFSLALERLQQPGSEELLTATEQEEEEAAAKAALAVLTGGAPGTEDPNVLSPTVALLFDVHFHGDAHQPLHVGFTSDYGGNRIHVHWYKKKTNLHEVWDTEIIKHDVLKYHGNKLADFVVYLAGRISGEWLPLVPKWAACDTGAACPNGFAADSIADACNWAYKDAPDGTTLGDEYFESRYPQVEIELAKGGVRLAATLNRLFSTNPASAAV